MTSATAHPRGTDERCDTDRRLSTSEGTLPALPMFETAWLATMRSRASSTRGAWDGSATDTMAGWLRLDE